MKSLPELYEEMKELLQKDAKLTDEEKFKILFGYDPPKGEPVHLP